MNDKRRDPFGQKPQDIETGLGNLFDALNQAVGQIATKLEDGKSGTISRDHIFETEKGPMRAHAGIRLRMGGIDVGGESPSTPQPVNRKKTPPAPPRPQQQPSAIPLQYDLFEDSGAWVLTADMPGVSRKDITLSQDGTDLVVQTSADRKYHARINLADPFDPDRITVSLRNGILSLNIPKETA
ncbi:Hsp20/alpha crystallin family protein [Sulfitobacter sp. JB4-11]|uniref:Hsp20/alpha crystallin family protein n=1 Tax=Sulfitobacter rhodophyticola TaxID=3238304 RepID=UPI0035186C82